jgi:hypothetical protein
MRKSIFVALVLLISLCANPYNPVFAAGCVATGDSCRLACQTRLSGDDQAAGRAGCISRCVTDQAACVAQSTIDEAARTANRDVLPWFDRQVERARSMIDEFWRRTP